MAFKPFKHLEDEAKERGYWRSDMDKTRRKILDRRRDWKHHFDQYVDILLHDDSARTAKQIVEKAEKLADEREALLDHKFEEDIEDE